VTLMNGVSESCSPVPLLYASAAL